MNPHVDDAVGAEALRDLVPEIVGADVAVAPPPVLGLALEERTVSTVVRAIAVQRTARVIVLQDVRRTVRGQEATRVTARSRLARNDPIWKCQDTRNTQAQALWPNHSSSFQSGCPVSLSCSVVLAFKGAVVSSSSSVALIESSSPSNPAKS